MLKLNVVTTSYGRTVVQTFGSLSGACGQWLADGCRALSDKLPNGGIRATKGIDIPNMPDVRTCTKLIFPERDDTNCFANLFWWFLSIIKQAFRYFQDCNVYEDFSGKKPNWQSRNCWFSNPASTSWYGNTYPIIYLHNLVNIGVLCTYVCTYGCAYVRMYVCMFKCMYIYTPRTQLTDPICWRSTFQNQAFFFHSKLGVNLGSRYVYMGVSKNNGTPKSSILIGFSIINHPFWGTPIFGNIHIYTHIFTLEPSNRFEKKTPSKSSTYPNQSSTYKQGHLESAWLVGQPNSLKTSDRNSTGKTWWPRHHNSNNIFWSQETLLKHQRWTCYIYIICKPRLTICKIMLFWNSIVSILCEGKLFNVRKANAWETLIHHMNMMYITDGSETLTNDLNWCMNSVINRMYPFAKVNSSIKGKLLDESWAPHFVKDDYVEHQPDWRNNGKKKALKKKDCLQKKNKSYECDTFFQTIFNSHVEIEKNPGSLGVVLREKNIPLGFFDGKYVLYMKP